MKETRKFIIKNKNEIMQILGLKDKLKELNDPDLMIEMLDKGNLQTENSLRSPQMHILRSNEIVSVNNGYKVMGSASLTQVP